MAITRTIYIFNSLFDDNVINNEHLDVGFRTFVITLITNVCIDVLHI